MSTYLNQSGHDLIHDPIGDDPKTFLANLMTEVRRLGQEKGHDYAASHVTATLFHVIVEGRRQAATARGTKAALRDAEAEIAARRGEFEEALDTIEELQIQLA